MLRTLPRTQSAHCSARVAIWSLYYPAMPSERIKSRVEMLVDEADQAIGLRQRHATSLSVSNKKPFTALS